MSWVGTVSYETETARGTSRAVLAFPDACLCEAAPGLLVRGESLNSGRGLRPLGEPMLRKGHIVNKGAVKTENQHLLSRRRALFLTLDELDLLHKALWLLANELEQTFSAQTETQAHLHDTYGLADQLRQTISFLSHQPIEWRGTHGTTN